MGSTCFAADFTALSDIFSREMFNTQGHLFRVDVVGERDVVQNRAGSAVGGREPALRGAAEFAVLCGDVVESGESYVEAEGA